VKKVITYGTFDLFHKGHENILRRARELGDYLYVGVTTEQFDVQRGKMNVTDSLMRRIDNVRASGFADEVIVEDHDGQKAEDIAKLGIDTFVLGSDWTGKFDYLKEYCEVVYLERTKNISTTEIKNSRGKLINLGIVGTGRIASRTCTEIRYVNGVTAAAVYNPHIKSAESFAAKVGIGFFSDNYDAFLENVQAVYIASPHETHFDYCKRALTAGKHVLCEKPMVMTEAEARELFDIAAEKKVVLMEAIKTAYTPGFNSLLAVARGGRIGRVVDVEAAFTKLVPFSTAQREYSGPFGGSFFELGSYPLLPIIKLLGRDYKNVEFRSFNAENGADYYAKAIFDYPGALATAKTGIGAKSEGQLLVTGTEGYILVKSPWWLFNSFEVCYEDTTLNENFQAPFYGYGLRFEIADFIKNINSPGLKNFKLTAADSIAFAAIMERFTTQKSTQKSEVRGQKTE
jgi:choline-phosphate cytidylyltransferase